MAKEDFLVYEEVAAGDAELTYQVLKQHAKAIRALQAKVRLLEIMVKRL